MYRAALLICPNNKLTNAKLHANIAAVYIKLRNYEEAVKVSLELADDMIISFGPSFPLTILVRLFQIHNRQRIFESSEE